MRVGATIIHTPDAQRTRWKSQSHTCIEWHGQDAAEGMIQSTSFFFLCLPLPALHPMWSLVAGQHMHCGMHTLGRDSFGGEWTTCTQDGRIFRMPNENASERMDTAPSSFISLSGFHAPS
jgi:hypothetical protein